MNKNKRTDKKYIQLQKKKLEKIEKKLEINELL